MRVMWRQVARWRMRRQQLVVDEPPSGSSIGSGQAADALAVARRVCGLHAKVTSCTALIAGVRSAATPDLAAALWTDRTLVRTWAMRGTLHLLPADELDLWTGAFTDRESRRRFPPSWEREHGVSGTDLHAITDAVGTVLGAQPLTRAELAAAVCRELRRPELAGPLATGWGALLKPAAARGLLCSGPPAEAGAVTFVSPAAWLARPLDPVAPDLAARRVLLRFLEANGPSTAADVARWWGEQPAPAKRWIQANADALTAVELDGETGFVVRVEDADELATTPTGPDATVGPVLLPGFDPWMIAPMSHRKRAVPPGREAEVSRTAGWISPVLVVDGTVAGVWDHTVDTDRLTITIRAFCPLPAPVRHATERHATRYARLLGPKTVTTMWT